MTEIQTWPNGVLPYVEGDELPALTRTRLHRAIETWNNSATPVKVQPRAKETSFVTFRLGRLSESARGRLGEGYQVIKLTPDARHGVMMHEIGHTVGLTHEHNRPDRDDHIEIVWQNIRTAAISQFQARVEESPSRPYDLDSIMHYAQMAFSSSNQPTIRIKGEMPPGRLVGQRRGLSQGDIEKLADLYQLPPSS